MSEVLDTPADTVIDTRPDVYSRNDQILDILKSAGSWGTTASAIAYELSCPEPSVRRSIQELIREGNHISYAGKGTGVYRLAQ